MEGLWNFVEDKETPVSVQCCELSCRNLEDKNVESSTDDGGLTYEVSKDYIGAICYLELRFCDSG